MKSLTFALHVLLILSVLLAGWAKGHVNTEALDQALISAVQQHGSSHAHPQNALTSEHDASTALMTDDSHGSCEPTQNTHTAHTQCFQHCLVLLPGPHVTSTTLVFSSLPTEALSTGKVAWFNFSFERPPMALS